MSPVDLSHLLSREAQRRKPSKLKELFAFKAEGVSYLAGGLPLPSAFAWDSLSATTTSPPFVNGITEMGLEAENGIKVTVDETSELPISVALQYGLSTGPAPLMKFLKEHTDMIHKLPYEDYDIVLTAGTTQSWCSCLRTFCNEGDSILVEKFCFSSSLETATNLGINLIPMEMDKKSIDAVKLDERLAQLQEKGSPLPKLMYIIPTGQNPTGLSIPTDRRQEIYQVAQKFNILIIEDEPYYFLQLEEYGKEAKELNKEEFLKSLLPSFLSMDVDGRVIRLDSFSKTLSPGSRVGWMTGQAKLLERFVREYETSIQTPSGFSTAIIFETLKTWGHDGYIAWLKALKKEYTYKRDATMDVCFKNLPLDIVTVNVPIAGMFFTLSIDASKHPEFATTYKSDPLAVESKIMEVASFDYKVVLVPGSWFEVHEEGEVESNEIFFRGTFAATGVDVIEEGLIGFGDAIRKVFGQI